MDWQRSALRGLHGRRGEPRHSQEPRLQRRHPGGRLLRPAHHPERPARQRGDRVPAPGDEAAERPCAHPRPCHQHHLRGQARGRRALHQGRQGRHAGRSAGQQGSHPRRRHLQFAAAAAIVRRRLAGTAGLARHRGAPRVAGRRRGIAGPLRAALGRARQEHQDHQRTAARPQPVGRGAEMGDDAARPAVAVADHGLLLLAFRRDAPKAPTCSSPSRPRATRRACRASSRTSPA